MKHNFRRWFVKPVSVILAAVMLLGLTGCNTLYESCVGCVVDFVVKEVNKARNISEEDIKSWDKEKTIPIAQSYLEEKYGEEFIYVSNSVPPYAYSNGLVVVCRFIRKDDAEAETPTKYKVDVDYKSGEYRVVGDGYMFVYIQKVAEDFLRPYVEKRFSDIEYVFSVYNTYTPCGALGGEYFADAKIPQNFDELYDVTHGISFEIIVPKSENQDKASEAYSLLKDDLENLNCEIKINAWFDVYGNDRFAEISQSTAAKRDAA